MIAYVLHEPQLQHSSGAIGVELYNFVKRDYFSSYESVFVFRIPLVWDMTLDHWVIGYRRFEVSFMVKAVH
jgi:hypothetical protein